jgi:glycosyltransferase involved in cell wall biosynthesis
VVARLEPENNVDLVMREFKASKARYPMVYVGGARYESDYSRGIFAQADERVRCVGPVYESGVLNGLYRHCRSYIHGHQVGGTNPSLLRAMAAGAPCVPIDVVFHREAAGDGARFFDKRPGSLGAIVEELEGDDALAARLGDIARSRAERYYRWDAVAAAYGEYFTSLAQARRAGRKAGRRECPVVYRPEAFSLDSPPRSG